MNRSRTRTLFRISAVLSAVTAVLAVVSLFSAEWIEITTGWDPDKGSGSAEKWIVVVLGAVSVLTGLTAAYARRRLAAAPQAA